MKGLLAHSSLKQIWEILRVGDCAGTAEIISNSKLVTGLRFPFKLRRLPSIRIPRAATIVRRPAGGAYDVELIVSPETNTNELTLEIVACPDTCQAQIHRNGDTIALKINVMGSESNQRSEVILVRWAYRGDSATESVRISMLKEN